MVPFPVTGRQAPPSGALNQVFEALIGRAGRETQRLREARLRTMVDTWTLVVAAVAWSQLGGWFTLVLSGRSWPWVWIAVDVVLQATRVGLARRLRAAIKMGATPPYVAATAADLAWFALMSCGIAGMAYSGEARLLVLAPILAIGFMGYLSSRYAAFPRLGSTLVCLLGVAAMAGLLTVPRMWLVAVLLPGAAAAFIILLRQNHQILLTALTAQEEQRQVSMHDPLTGLPNRLLLWERMSTLSSADEEAFAVLCLDLDGFKPVNDRYGHAGGDWLLKSIAERMQGLLREDDLVCRIGGDEFVVLLPGAGRAEAVRVAERLIAACQQPHDVGAAAMARVGVSVGIALAPEQASETDLLLSYADKALYESKRRSKGVWTLYSADLAG